MLRGGVVLEKHRQGAVGGGVGRGEQPAGDFLLQHDDQATQPLAGKKELCKNRHAGLIGQIGDNHQGLGQGLVIVGPCVGLQNVDVRRFRKQFPHGLDIARINFQGVQACCPARQGSGEDAPAGAYFQSGLAARECGASHDAFDHGPVAQKYLPQSLAAVRILPGHAL